MNVQQPFILLLVRHGMTEWSAAGRHTGLSDIPLTPEGRLQAEQAGLALQNLLQERKVALYTSPLSRAMTTAALLKIGEATSLPDAHEWDYGSYEGRTTQEIQQDAPGWNIWDGSVPGGETISDVGERADRVIAAIRKGDSPAVLVAHGHFLRILASRWVGQHPRIGRHLALETASISTLGFEREVPAILVWNSTAHLDRS